ncbi:MAG: hypothetical protein Fur0037_24970 [Planctomycetota bacterium]
MAAMRRAAWLGFVVLLGLPSCVGEAETQALSRPFARASLGLARLLDHQLGPQRLQGGASSIARDMGRMLAPEARGPSGWARDGSFILSADVRRAGRFPGAAENLGFAELRRAAALPDALASILPSPEGLDRRSRRIRGDFASLLGLDRRPLGELEDPEHRTDPKDRRPVPSMLQRVLRRLWR